VLVLAQVLEPEQVPEPEQVLVPARVQVPGLADAALAYYIYHACRLRHRTLQCLLKTTRLS
jgi:hypothetical protein